MEVRLAESAGFCFGVQRAVDTVYEQIEKADGEKKIYTYGPIIHNAEVVNDLKSRGVDAIESFDEIKKLKGHTMIIRSHGVSEDVYKEAAENGVNVVDATCPFVKKIHRIVSEEGQKGSHIIIMGDASHPEVAGIMGWAKGPVTVIDSEEKAREFAPGAETKICIVAQTTFNTQKFNKFVEIIQKRGYDTNVINTICNATAVRQREAAEISVQADKMIVIGDPHSSNTKKLYDICKSNCKDTYHIQTVKDLCRTDLQSGKCVGITAGASTPNYLIQEVLLYVGGISFQ